MFRVEFRLTIECKDGEGLLWKVEEKLPFVPIAGMTFSFDEDYYVDPPLDMFHVERVEYDLSIGNFYVYSTLEENSIGLQDLVNILEKEGWEQIRKWK